MISIFGLLERYKTQIMDLVSESESGSDVSDPMDCGSDEPNVLQNMCYKV